MDIIVSYSKAELEAAVNFIAKNNKFFQNKYQTIRESLLEHIEYLASNPNITTVGTMGYLLVADYQPEGVDNDHNFCRIEIYVSPALGSAHLEDDIVEKTITTSIVEE